MISVNLKEAAAFLMGCDGCLIYTHASPDGDTIGSATALALALRAKGKRAYAFCADGIPQKLGFLPTDDIFIDIEDQSLTAISVDVASEKLLGRANNRHFALSIDHHKVNTVNCERLLCLSDRVSCGEIVFLLAEELEIELTKDMATALYTAMCSDSGGFKYEATKSETYIMAAKCIDAGIDFADINRRLFENKTPSQVALIKTAYHNLELLRNGKFAIVAISPEEVKSCGASEMDFDCINSIPREIEGVMASAVIRMKTDGVKVSLRSNDDIDVSEIAKRFGGGGHYHAAGFNLGFDFPNAVETVKNAFLELSI